MYKDFTKKKEGISAEYVCADCGGTEWEIVIYHDSEDTTLLNLYCANKDCPIYSQELEDGETHIWESFDITNQGYDKEDILECMDIETDEDRLLN